MSETCFSLEIMAQGISTSCTSPNTDSLPYLCTFHLLSTIILSLANILHNFNVQPINDYFWKTSLTLQAKLFSPFFVLLKSPIRDSLDFIILGSKNYI